MKSKSKKARMIASKKKKYYASQRFNKDELLKI